MKFLFNAMFFLLSDFGMSLICVCLSLCQKLCNASWD